MYKIDAWCALLPGPCHTTDARTANRWITPRQRPAPAARTHDRVCACASARICVAVATMPAVRDPIKTVRQVEDGHQGRRAAPPQSPAVSGQAQLPAPAPASAPGLPASRPAPHHRKEQSAPNQARCMATQVKFGVNEGDARRHRPTCRMETSSTPA